MKKLLSSIILILFPIVLIAENKDFMELKTLGNYLLVKDVYYYGDPPTLDTTDKIVFYKKELDKFIYYIIDINLESYVEKYTEDSLITFDLKSNSTKREYSDLNKKVSIISALNVIVKERVSLFDYSEYDILPKYFSEYENEKLVNYEVVLDNPKDSYHSTETYIRNYTTNSFVFQFQLLINRMQVRALDAKFVYTRIIDKNKIDKIIKLIYSLN